jgi:emfourin
MRVSITKGGTIVPILTTAEIDSDTLTAHEAEALRKLVEKAGIGERAAAAAPAAAGSAPAGAGSAQAGAGSAQPDRGSYRITVDDQDRRASVSLADADLRPEARKLVDWVSDHPKAIHRTKPLGS